jgi:adenylosuccinate synthase
MNAAMASVAKKSSSSSRARLFSTMRSSRRRFKSSSSSSSSSSSARSSLMLRSPWFARKQQRFMSSNAVDVSGYNSRVMAVLGAQWGDEGKGKLVDILAAHYDIVARFNGGSNAGHTLVVDGKKFAFHLLPCGMLYAGKINVIGNGVVLHTPTLLTELESLTEANICFHDRLKISDRAHLLFGFHRIVDGMQESALKGKSIGTTGKGIGPCYSSKATRNAVRVGDLLHWDSFEQKTRKLCADMQAMYGNFEYDIDAEIKMYKDEYLPFFQKNNMITDTVQYLDAAYREGKNILAEGANAALLDVDFGTYPFVTSSCTTAGGVATGLGMAPSKLDTTIGIVKAYTTRVGEGPFPTELHCDVGKELGSVGHEFGTTTGRPRRCGWLDLPVVQYSNILNAYSSINITKLDVLSGLKEIKLGTHYVIDGKELPLGAMPSTLDRLGAVKVKYETMPGWLSDISECSTFEQLPKEAQQYLNRIEELLGVPVSWVGTGPGRLEMATKGFIAKQ